MGVGVTAQGSDIGALPGPPTDFVATLVTNYRVDLTWTIGVNATKTIIIAKYGSPADNITDGYEVYNGTGDNVTDWIPNIEFESQILYYRAWSWNVNGYSAGYADASVQGGTGMLIFGFICLCGLLTGLSGWKRFLPLAMAASIAWLAFGILLLTSPSTIGLGSISTTWVQALGFALVLMIFVPILLYIKPTTTFHKTKDGVSWTEQGWAPKDKTSRREQAQQDYKQQLRAKWRR